MARSMTLQVVLVAAVLGRTLAFPNFYPDRVAPDAECDAHPDQGFKGHGAPVEEAGLEFMVANTDGVAVSKYCPGRTYDVTITFASPFKSKLTVSVGELGGADSDCPNTQNFLGDDSNTALDTYTTSWTIPCAEDGGDDSEEAVLFVTGATSASSEYMNNKLTLQQKDTCDVC